MTKIQLATSVTALAFGPDGTLFGLAPTEKKIVTIDAQGATRPVATGIVGAQLVVTNSGTLFVSEPGEHTDQPSTLWQISPRGEKTVIDRGIRSASGVVFSPDGGLFFAAEKSSQWIYSFVVTDDGKFSHKQAYYWLHQPDIPNHSGAEAMAVDQKGNLYVASAMGVQICDQNGRVRAILVPPTPSGPLRGICFGGSQRDVLYVTDGIRVFKRPLRVQGQPAWAKPIPYASQGQG